MSFNWPSHWHVEVADHKSTLIERVRQARGFGDETEWHNWLQLDFDKSFLDPWSLPDMKVAVARLIQAKKKKEQIGIYGDYDADGLPGAALLLRGLTLAGFERLICIIPTRDEGYGLRAAKIDWLAEQGVTLILTVDTGITAATEIKLANDKGIDVIVTDHHEPIGNLPPALAVVDPKRADSTYQNRDLVGTGVAYKLLWALYEKLGISHTPLKWQLDLVAVATIADMMELNAENRVLVHYGLQVLRKSRNVGLAALMRVAGMVLDKVDTGQISFGIAPRLNAPSRLARERHEIGQQVVDNVVLTLLTTTDEQQALEAAALINQLNLHRQNSIQALVNEALQLKAVPTGGGVYYLPEAPAGLVGLVAGQLSELSGWPVLVMADINGSTRGSARSPTKLSIVDLLTAHASYLSQFGGHAQAGGFSVKPTKVKGFCQQVERYLAEQARQYPATTDRLVDTVIEPTEANLANAKILDQLAPFGIGNPKPRFALTATVREVKRLGKEGQHVRLQFEQPYPAAIWFGVKQTLPEVGQSIAAIANLAVNNYWQPTPQLGIIELVNL
ncbi:MAG: single-stranded-DNA-specific exonuclease RecJ [bacterium]|nr:single-stranded-DNA-specific exonuclease RecJ [bacterium]